MTSTLFLRKIGKEQTVFPGIRFLKTKAIVNVCLIFPQFSNFLFFCSVFERRIRTSLINLLTFSEVLLRRLSLHVEDVASICTLQPQ